MKVRKVLIGIDNSTFAEHAAEYGFDIAKTYGAKVGLVHIVEPVIMPATTNADMIGIPVMDVGMNDAELIKIQNEASETLIEKTIKKFAHGLDVTHFNEFGGKADGILSCAKEFNADLIVIGTHSRTGLDRLLMGSTAEHVVRHSPIPVLVVPFPKGE